MVRNTLPVDPASQAALLALMAEVAPPPSSRRSALTQTLVNDEPLRAFRAELVAELYEEISLDDLIASLESQ